MRVAEAALVAEPALVDLRVVAGEDPLHLPLAGRRGDVAADRAEAADRWDVLDLPRPRLEAVLRRSQRADRAELDHVPGERRLVGAVLEGGDVGARAALARDQLTVLGDALGEPRAAVAEDAALAVERDRRRDRDRLLEGALGEAHARVPRAIPERQVLQWALAALVADRAVERMVDEDELERCVLCLGGQRRGRGRLHDHAVGGRQRARGLGLRRSGRHLAEAHAAGPDGRTEPRLVAEHGNLDPGVERSLDEPDPLRHLDLDVVDGDRDELRLVAVTAHAVTSGSGFSTARWWCCSLGARMPSSDELPPKGQRPWWIWATNSSRHFAMYDETG